MKRASMMLALMTIAALAMANEPPIEGVYETTGAMWTFDLKTETFSDEMLVGRFLRVGVNYAQRRVYLLVDTDDDGYYDDEGAPTEFVLRYADDHIWWVEQPDIFAMFWYANDSDTYYMTLREDGEGETLYLEMYFSYGWTE